MSKITGFSVRTDQHTEMIDITREVQGVVREKNIDRGVCIVFVPHTTAAVTINENADPDVVRDGRLTLSHNIIIQESRI